MKKLSKKEKAIHDQFSWYGANAKEWMHKCILMLPQIEMERIWEKKGFPSIYEYAAKIAGMSRYKVTDSLRIIRKIADKPALMEVAKVKGLNSVRPVATIATKENDKFWAGKVDEMAKNTLETFVKDFKNESGPRTKFLIKSGSNKPESSEISMKLEPEVFEALKKIKGAGDWNEAMKKLLRLQVEKPAPVRSNTHKAPVAIEKYIKKRSGGECEHPNCNKTGEQIHHIEPFALTKKHDPDTMLHLCKGHHQIIHLGYIDDGEIQVGVASWEDAGGDVNDLGASKSVEGGVRQQKQWQQIEGLPNYDIKTLINGRVAEFR